MQIFINGDLTKPLSDAVDESPFSQELRDMLCREILASATSRLGETGFLGLLDCGDPEALPTGDFVIRYKLTGAGEQFVAALRALADAAKVVRSHSECS